MKTAKMHDRETMLANLLKVNNASHLAQRFYPKLLDVAGMDLAGVDVAMNIALALYDYLEGMPASMSAVMRMMAPDFIDAMTDDEEARREAKETLEQTNK